MLENLSPQEAALLCTQELHYSSTGSVSLNTSTVIYSDVEIVLVKQVCLGKPMQTLFFKGKRCCQTLTCCCASVARRGKCSVVQLIYKIVWTTRNLQTAAPPLWRGKQRITTSEGLGYDHTMVFYSRVISEHVFVAILGCDLVSFNLIYKSSRGCVHLCFTHQHNEQWQ